MAQLDDVEVASRYDGIATGPRLEYSFETQTGVPVDGGNALLRQMSPFQIQLIPPAALANAVDEDIALVDLITAAAQGVDKNTSAAALSSALSQATAVADSPETIETFVSSGQFLANQDSDYYVTLSDAYTAANIALQLDRILNAPVLTLLVNPNNLVINYTNIQNYGTRTRNGYLFERWGEEQPTMSISGSTGAYIAGAANAPGTLSTLAQVNGETTSPTGVQFASKRDSAAWQNLVSLFHFFKSNGYIYDTVAGTEAHLFVGSVAISYDQFTYVGNIDSFSYGYKAETPHRMEWSMEFVVNQILDSAQSPVVVLPHTNVPTTSPQGFISTPASPGGSLGDAIAGVGSSFDAATSPESEFGTIPFELLTP